jgi:hypothetical protein
METREMRCFTFLAIAALAACVYGRATAPRVSPLARRVVVIDRTDISALVTNIVTDLRDIAALEALFPSYQTRPESDIAVAYIAQYNFIFELSDGDSILVVSDGDGRLWSTGSGDFPVEGDLKRTVSRLKR